MEQLKRLLMKECDYEPREETLDLLLASSEAMTLGADFEIIPTGAVIRDLFIVKSGIIRSVDMDGEKERTLGFGTAGSVFTSKHSFVKGLPSYYTFETCCPSEILRLPFASYQRLIRDCPDFAMWMLYYANEELFLNEVRNSQVINGSAKERYLALCKARPEILRKVKQRTIASYLGVTPEYLSRLRKLKD